MTFTLRPYQREAVDAAVSFLRGPSPHNAIEVLPTGSGKSLIIANIALDLGEPVLIFQPSREILQQNLAKLASYGYHAGVYSASAGRAEVSNITLATIGSVIGKSSLFENFRYIIIDECHLVNAQEGLYKTFLETLTAAGAKVLGLTATPYRVVTNGCTELRFLTQTSPRIFHDMIYCVQNRDLFNSGYLSRLEYATPNPFDRSELRINSTGADFTDESVRNYYRRSDFPDILVGVIRDQMKERRNALVFTRFVEEAEYLVSRIPNSAIVTGVSTKRERARVINGFKRGSLDVVCNVGVLSVGFDYPELETVVTGRPIMSLALWYQMIGRCTRPHPQKACARVVDMCGNYATFGRVEDLEIVDGGNGKWHIASGDRQLTNVYYGERS